MKIRQALAQILRLDSYSGWRRVVHVPNTAGQVVNDFTALQLSAVWACVRLISETISTLSLDVVEKQRDGTSRPSSHNLQFILGDMPNADTTSAVFWEAMIAAMLLRGNGVAEKRYNAAGSLVALEFLSWDRLSISRDAQGNRIWRYTDTPGTQRVIAEDKIFRVPGFTLDGDWGVSAVEYGAAVIGGAMAAANSANGTFEKGLAPTVAFKMSNFLKPAQREEFRDNFDKMGGALNAGRPVLLEGGMDVTTVGIKPSDAQLLESRGFSVEEICRWFRVPPHMVGHSEKSTSWGTGIEQQMIGFLTFTLRPWLKRIEQAIRKDLMTPTERVRLKAKFQVEDLLRADSAARAAFYEKMVGSGIYTRDEVRIIENLQPMGGNAAVLTVNSAYQPIDSLGVQPDAQGTS